MTEIEALFAKRDAQWSAYCKKRDRSETVFNFTIIGVAIAVVTIIGMI